MKVIFFCILLSLCYCSRNAHLLSDFNPSKFLLDTVTIPIKKLEICKRLLVVVINDRLLHLLLKYNSQATNYEAYHQFLRLYQLRQSCIDQIKSDCFQSEMRSLGVPLNVLTVFLYSLNAINYTLFREMFWNIIQHYIMICAFHTGGASHVRMKNNFDDQFPLKFGKDTDYALLKNKLWSEVQQIRGKPKISINKDNYRNILFKIKYNEKTITPYHQSFMPSVLVEVVKLLFIEDLIIDLSLVSSKINSYMIEMSHLSSLHQKLGMAIFQYGSQLRCASKFLTNVPMETAKTLLPPDHQPHIKFDPISKVHIFLVKGDRNLRATGNFSISKNFIKVFLSNTTPDSIIFDVYEQICSLVNSSDALKCSDFENILKVTINKSA